MTPPVQILKFLAIKGAENRDAEGVRGKRNRLGDLRKHRKLPKRDPGQSSGRKRVLEYLELEKKTTGSLSGVFF